MATTTTTTDIERSHTTPPADGEHRATGAHGRWPLARHYLEMVAAMFVGMAVLGGLVAGILALIGADKPDRPEVTALEMAVYMAVGMVVWMRHRGHAWPGTLEMAGAMFVPALALFPPLWGGAISGDDLLMLEHVVMLPLMYLVMRRRRREYGTGLATGHPVPGAGALHHEQ